MRDTTLLFLVTRDKGVVTHICLAMKKRGFGAGRYNGTGGKVETGESIEDSAKREAQEEIGVTVNTMSKCAELSFTFPHKEDWNQLVHVYLSESWEGDILESDEMKPEWFTVGGIPYTTMWPDDIFWLPKVLAGDFVKAAFSFGEGDVILSQEVITV